MFQQGKTRKRTLPIRKKTDEAPALNQSNTEIPYGFKYSVMYLNKTKSEQKSYDSRMASEKATGALKWRFKRQTTLPTIH
jgi:hypothetical protein